MPIFLLIVSILLLLVSGISYWQLIKQTPRRFFQELDALGLGNGSLQVFYALTGFYLLYLLTVMNYVRPLVIPAIILSLDSLLFLLVLRRYAYSNRLSGYFRSGFGLYVSGTMQTAFLLAAIYLLAIRSTGA
jgi:hypothetical protein